MSEAELQVPGRVMSWAVDAGVALNRAKSILDECGYQATPGLCRLQISAALKAVREAKRALEMMRFSLETTKVE